MKNIDHVVKIHRKTWQELALVFLTSHCALATHNCYQILFYVEWIWSRTVKISSLTGM